MYCILIAGLPACGKSTLAASLADALALPLFSKDEIKERLFDAVGFRSREEKVRLGVASEEILYDVAEQMMKRRQAFLFGKQLRGRLPAQACAPVGRLWLPGLYRGAYRRTQGAL